MTSLHAAPRPLLLLYAGVLLIGTHAAEGADRSAKASASVIRPIAVTRVTDLSFGRLQGTAQDGTVTLPARAPSKPVATAVTMVKGGTTESAFERQLSGEPGRLYRVTVPASTYTTTGRLLVNAFTLWTANRQDVSSTKMSVFDKKGADTLRLGATLRVPKNTPLAQYDAQVAVTISYE